jgi:hypothetical protein
MTVEDLIKILNEFEGDLPTTVGQVSLSASEDFDDLDEDDYDVFGNLIGDNVEGEITWRVIVN